MDRSKSRTGAAAGWGGAVVLVTVLVTLSGCNPPNSWLRQRGIEAIQDNNLPAAEARFEQALRQQPGDWISNYRLGWIRLQQKRPLDAQLLLEKALTLRPADPETPDIMDLLAEALFQQRADAQLYSFLQEAADQRGEVRDYLRQAQYLTKLGDVDAAKLAYRKAVRMSAANDPTPHIAMANFYESVGDRASAVMALRRAYTITPNDPNLANRFRGYGIVPGPTLYVEPEPQPQ